jgi:uncharacterized membrane protein
MAEKDDQKGHADGQDVLARSVERLRHELTGFLGAQAHRLTDAAAGRIGDLAGHPGGAAKTLKEAATGKVKEAAVGKAKEATVDKVKDAVSGGVKNKVTGGGLKVTNIIEHIDVGLPLRDCYNHWTQYESFNDFMKGVVGVTRTDEVESDWKLKIAFSNRGWHATVLEQIPDDRIEWTSEGAKGSTRGVVSFHALTPNLTRIVVVVEYQPAGFFEKTANIWRAQGRRLRLDLKHFQRYVTLEAEEVPEGWRGEIRDGEVVRQHGEEPRDDEEPGEEETDEEPEDDELAGEDEPDEDPDEEPDEEEAEEARAAARRRKRGNR